MNRCDDQGENIDVVQYHGVPNPPHSLGEKTRWQRFLEWAMPWLKQKWAMGEAVLAAKAVQEVATARRMKAEAVSAEAKASQDMMQTLATARQMELEKLAAGNGAQASQAELEEELRLLQAKLNELSWRYGTRIHIGLENDEVIGSVDATMKTVEELVRSLTQEPVED